MSDVGIADLKARLSEHLRKVRRGGTVVIRDRETPIARIVPYADPALQIRKATRRPSALPLPTAPISPTDSLADLLEDRGRR
jgi:prevent-host-death family protein